MVMERIQQGGSFSSLASEFSTCPSKKQGGSLGSFRPGTMVPEFDKVIFNPDTKLNEVVGPIMTTVSTVALAEHSFELLCVGWFCSVSSFRETVWISPHSSRKANRCLDMLHIANYGGLCLEYNSVRTTAQRINLGLASASH